MTASMTLTGGFAATGCAAPVVASRGLLHLRLRQRRRLDLLRQPRHASRNGRGGAKTRQRVAGFFGAIGGRLVGRRFGRRRRRDRPRSRVRFDWLDVVRTLGLDFRAATPPAALGRRGALRLRYGLSAYRDGISSSEASSSPA